MSYYQEAKIRLKEKYDIDIIKDMFLENENFVVLFADSSNKNLCFEVISGDMEKIGFKGQSVVGLDHILDCIDYDNKYAEVGSKADYRRYVHSNFFVNGGLSEVTFPIKRNKQRLWLRFSIFPIKNSKDLYSIFVSNLTEMMNSEELNYEKTHKDALTGLFNNYTFNYHYGKRYQMPNLHVFYLDLDDFKGINDKNGHIVGNECLVEFAKVLKMHENEFDRFYRIGGDEFVGLVFKEKIEIDSIAKDIIERTNQIVLSESTSKISVSIGVAKYNTAYDPVRKADELLYKVKESGKNNYIYE